MIGCVLVGFSLTRCQLFIPVRYFCLQFSWCYGYFSCNSLFDHSVCNELFEQMFFHNKFGSSLCARTLIFVAQKMALLLYYIFFKRPKSLFQDKLPEVCASTGNETVFLQSTFNQLFTGFAIYSNIWSHLTFSHLFPSLHHSLLFFPRYSEHFIPVTLPFFI